jgi:hypothetical protein
VLNPFTLAAVSFLTAATPVFSSSTQDLFAKYGQPKEPPPFAIIKEFDTVAIKEVEAVILMKTAPLLFYKTTALPIVML